MLTKWNYLLGGYTDVSDGWAKIFQREHEIFQSKIIALKWCFIFNGAKQIERLRTLMLHEIPKVLFSHTPIVFLSFLNPVRTQNLAPRNHGAQNKWLNLGNYLRSRKWPLDMKAEFKRTSREWNPQTSNSSQVPL